MSWVRSLDGTRWEARRQYDPQRARWANHRSWINRTLGRGAWTEADRSEEGYAFGPFMELWDDGRSTCGATGGRSTSFPRIR